MTKPVLGYIGLGAMGKPCVINLLKAGYQVNVWARRTEAMADVVEEGAVACDTAADLARQSSVIFTNVSDTCDVEQVIFGERGLAESIRAGTTIIDMSTISANATREMSERLLSFGVDLLDAPVSGGDQGARDGMLSIMVGGKEEVYQQVLPILEVMGGNIVYIGPSGAGQVTKACNQVVIAQSMIAVSEAFILAQASGVDPAKVRKALMGGSAGSRVLDVHGLRMLEENYKPGFRAALHKKDMRIVMDNAEKAGISLPGAALASQFYNVLVGQGNGELDSAAVSMVQQRMNNVSFKK